MTPSWGLVRRYGVTALLLALLVGSFAVSWFQLPFIVVHGSSMQPTYETGDLVTVEPTSVSSIQKGDIVVVDVPYAAQREYGYPDRIVHRVVEVSTSGSHVTFRTKGDNTGEDPFTVYPQNVVGEAGDHYSNLGFALLYLQSIHGKLFIFSVFLVELVYSAVPTARREIGSYIDSFIERHSPSRNVERKLDELDEDVQRVDESLDHFADAMDEYATHLESHTAAVQNMAQAADGIQRSVERQTALLDRMESGELGEEGAAPGSEPARAAARDRGEAPSSGGTEREESTANGTDFEWAADRDRGKAIDGRDKTEDGRGERDDAFEWVDDGNTSETGDDRVGTETEFEWVDESHGDG